MEQPRDIRIVLDDIMRTIVDQLPVGKNPRAVALKVHYEDETIALTVELEGEDARAELEVSFPAADAEPVRE